MSGLQRRPGPSALAGRSRRPSCRSGRAAGDPQALLPEHMSPSFSLFFFYRRFEPCRTPLTGRPDSPYFLEGGRPQPGGAERADRGALELSGICRSSS